MKVVIGVLMANDFPVPAAFVKSLVLLQQIALTGVGNKLLPREWQIDSINMMFSSNFPIDFARNFLCRSFLDGDGDYLLCLDTDMTHPPDTPHRLLKHGVDVVTGRYVIRKPPFFTVAMRKTGDGPHDYQAIEKLTPDGKVSGLVPIDAGGAGALMLSRTCLQTITDRIGDDWFRYQDGPAGKRSRSEDMWFYEQAIAAGFQPWLDADLHCGHVRSEIVNAKDHEPFAAAYREAMEKDEVVA